MKIQKVIQKQIENLNTFMRVSSYVPQDLEICEFSDYFSIDIKGEYTLKKCLEILKHIREESTFPSRIESYYLGEYWDKSWNKSEGLRISYRVAPLEELNKNKGVIYRFMVKSPSSSLKKLGLKCRIKNVTTDAKFIKSTSSREIVCPVS